MAKTGENEAFGGSTWVFQNAGEIALGAGSARRTGELLAKLEVRSCLLVADANLRSHAELVRDSIQEAGISCIVFEGGVPEPTVALTADLMGRLKGRAVEAVIGLGGGSNIDLAKAAAVLASHGGCIEDYAGQNQLPGPVLPVVAIPTTAGSGSEVSGACILGLPDDGSKLGVVDNRLRPRIAIVDPLLQRSCPPEVTRDSGLDALCHAVEALTIVETEHFPRDAATPWPLYQGKHALGDALAERAIALIVEHLPRVLERPDDLAARSGMSVGALLAGIAMSNTGIYTVHALSYPVGAFTGASHGACNAVLLPAVLDFVEGVRQVEAGRILELMGSDRERPGDAVRDLLAAVGAPRCLSELGLPRAELERAAEIAHGIRRLMNGSPRPTSREDLVRILESAYGGQS